MNLPLPESLTLGVMQSRAQFAHDVRAALLAALQSGQREIWCMDADFSAWCWSDAELLQALGQWARLPQRQLVLVAQHYDLVARLHPRFVRWRGVFDHVVRPWAHPEVGVAGAGLMGALWVPGFLQLRLLDAQLARYVLSQSEETDVVLGAFFDALVQRSQQSFGASTLGL